MKPSRVLGEPEDEPALGARGWIMLVEDDAELRDVLADILRTYGFRVTEAGDGLDALDVLRREYTAASVQPGARLVPDCIVFDLAMPRGDGAWLMSQLGMHPQYRSVPRLAMSSDTRLDDFVRWAAQRPELGRVPGTLSKPFDGRAFVLRVEECISEGCGTVAEVTALAKHVAEQDGAILKVRHDIGELKRQRVEDKSDRARELHEHLEAVRGHVESRLAPMQKDLTGIRGDMVQVLDLQREAQGWRATIQHVQVDREAEAKAREMMAARDADVARGLGHAQQAATVVDPRVNAPKQRRVTVLAALIAGCATLAAALIAALVALIRGK